MKPDAPTVSVIIPNYNYEKTLPACLDAVFAQTLQPLEVIVVDDASTDRSREIIRGYPCRLIENPGNSGVSAVRNRGAAESRGDILFFVDSDVALAPDALENAVRILTEDPGCGFVHGVPAAQPLFDDGPVERYRVLHAHHFHRRSVGVVASAFFALGAVRREVFEAVGPLNERLRDSEDLEYSNRLHGRCRIRLTDTITGRHDDADSLRALLREQARRAQLLIPFAAAHRAQRDAVRAHSMTGVLAVALTMATLPLVPLAPVVPALCLLVAAAADPGLSRFVLRERGPAFLAYFTGVHLMVQASIVVGAAWGGLRMLRDRGFGRPDAGRIGPPTEASAR
ncbi:glycosyltransferase family 2 protein [Streptomyces sp. NPDC000070]|uniref:glycosyltransferase family 2 protein n=1 Tax=Streptomyces sp. NPDC000070 TaxID=3154240 RepID=UPI003318A8BC